MNKEVLQEMIKEQKQIIKQAQTQLQKLYAMAKDSGISIDEEMPLVQENFTKTYIEEQRKQIMQRVSALREQTLAQTQNIINNLNTSNFNAPKIPDMPESAGMPISMENLKTQFKEILEQKRDDLSPEMVEKLHEMSNGDEDV